MLDYRKEWSPRSLKKSPFQIRIFQLVITNNREKPNGLFSLTSHATSRVEATTIHPGLAVLTSAAA